MDPRHDAWGEHVVAHQTRQPYSTFLAAPLPARVSLRNHESSMRIVERLYSKASLKVVVVGATVVLVLNPRLHRPASSAYDLPHRAGLTSSNKLPILPPALLHR